MEVIKVRRSIRKFSKEAISEENLDKLVRAGMQAPTATNQQANCFYIVRKRENLDILGDKLQNARMLKDANAAIIVLINKNKLNKPTMKSQDAASATTNILLEATYLGIGSCWCGIYPSVERMDIIREVLKLEEDFIPFSIIALGYPENENQFYFIDRYDEAKVFRD